MKKEKTTKEVSFKMDKLSLKSQKMIKTVRINGYYHVMVETDRSEFGLQNPCYMGNYGFALHEIRKV